MTRKDKTEMRQIIEQKIALGNSRFQEADLLLLFDIVTNICSYSRKTKTIKSQHTGWSSEGKYTRTEVNTYSIHDGNKITARCDYSFHDDDGESGKSVHIYDLPRDIIKIARIIKNG